jgi:hypothetical protein
MEFGVIPDKIGNSDIGYYVHGSTAPPCRPFLAIPDLVLLLVLASANLLGVMLDPTLRWPLRAPALAVWRFRGGRFVMVPQLLPQRANESILIAQRGRR